MHWYMELAGGNFLPQALDNNVVEVNMERVLAWNPDIILISGWGHAKDGFKNNPNWRSVQAARNRQVYMIPQGIFDWDLASGESVLLAIYMAKRYQPLLAAHTGIAHFKIYRVNFLIDVYTVLDVWQTHFNQI